MSLVYARADVLNRGPFNMLFDDYRASKMCYTAFNLITNFKNDKHFFAKFSNFKAIILFEEK